MPRKSPHPETCERCPNRYSERGCPCWLRADHGLVETNIATGEERITTGCMWDHLPRWFANVIMASNRPAAAVESCRNEIARGFERVAIAASKIQPVMLGGDRDG